MPDTAPKSREDELPVSESKLLAILGDERRRSVGFEHDAELTGQREKALNYYKGELPDVTSAKNRSSAVASTVRDAIDTLLPDLQEMLTGGDDVAAFLPRGPEDEQAAQQETDYVNHVVFNENDGWMILHTMIKDACLVKTGLAKFWWEDYADEEETLEGKTILDIPQLQQEGEIIAAEPGEDGETLDVTLRRKARGRLCIKAVPPEDFTVAADTISLRSATYCAVRSRPRAQDLIAQGIDRDIVDQLPAFAASRNEAMDVARDTAGESELAAGGGTGDLRFVEVVEHYIRLEKDGKLQLWRVMTGGEESVFIDAERVDMIPIAAITPFVVTHRFYGESVADRLLELQRIMSVLTRSHLDSLYFALNQRQEVAMSRANEFTIADLLRNEPGMPVRSQSGDAVRPITAGTMNFNTLEALEYYNTVAEQRSGIVRAAQGMAPDTLHDTAKGALALLTQAQKRVRMIARIFAETGLKDLFLGVHAMLRKHATQEATVRLRGQWTNVAPTSWGRRDDMSIEIGLGASGREHEMMQIQQQLGVVSQVLEMQGGPQGPFITPDNVYNLLKRFFEKSGAKAPELYVTDPKEAPPQEPQPDPKMVEVKGKMQLEQAKAQIQQQTDAQKAQADFQLKQMEMQANLQLKEKQIAAELDLKREQLGAEIQMKRELAMIDMQIRAQTAGRDADREDYRASAETSEVNVGGEPG